MQGFVMLLEPVGHVVGVEYGHLGGPLQAPGPHHLDVGPGDGQDGGGPEGGGADHPKGPGLLAHVGGGASADDGMGGEEGGQVGLDIHNAGDKLKFSSILRRRSSGTIIIF